MSKDIFPVEVFSGSEWESQIIIGLLENEGVAAYLINEISGTLMPWVFSPGGLGAVKVSVSNIDLELAEKVVAAFLDKNGKND